MSAITFADFLRYGKPVATENRVERLQRAITDAVRRLECRSQRPQDRLPGPAPGDLYVFDTPVEAAIEWLVVRPHPDDAALVLLAPVDVFTLIGRSDVSLRHGFLDRPLTVRCGEAAWVPATSCPVHLRVGVIPDEALAPVRLKLAALARGNLPDAPGSTHVEADPEYAAWLEQIARARESLF